MVELMIWRARIGIWNGKTIVIGKSKNRPHTSHTFGLYHLYSTSLIFWLIISLAMVIKLITKVRRLCNPCVHRIVIFIWNFTIIYPIMTWLLIKLMGQVILHYTYYINIKLLSIILLNILPYTTVCELMSLTYKLLYMTLDVNYIWIGITLYCLTQTK